MVVITQGACPPAPVPASGSHGTGSREHPPSRHGSRLCSPPGIGPNGREAELHLWLGRIEAVIGGQKHLVCLRDPFEFSLSPLRLVLQSALPWVVAPRGRHRQGLRQRPVRHAAGMARLAVRPNGQLEPFGPLSVAASAMRQRLPRNRCGQCLPGTSRQTRFVSFVVPSKGLV